MGSRTSEDIWENGKSPALAGIKPRVIGSPDLSWMTYREGVLIAELPYSSS
jgi:hypothetical protein